MEFAGKKALVTGASRGVGRAIAEAFVEKGIQVFGTSRNPDSVDWPEGVTGLALDASSVESVVAAWDAGDFSQYEFDIVVNNAGGGAMGGFADSDFGVWQDQIDLLLLAPMRLSQLAMQSWGPEKPGVLVNVTSLAVEYPIPYFTGYNAAKSGFASFCESLLLEVNPEVVSVVEMRLGDTRTGFNAAVQGGPRTPRQERAWQALEDNLKIAPKPEAAAAALVRFLAKDGKGTVRVGNFFQRTIASIFGRLVSQSIRLWVDGLYYKLGKA